MCQSVKMGVYGFISLLPDAVKALASLKVNEKLLAEKVT